ncbi:MAG: outer membrane lipoprotein-sorting protein [Thermodesulfobacteriota bacterium]
MKSSKLLSGTVGVVLLLLCLPAALWAVTAREILEKAALNSLTENFRAVLNIKTFKGQKLVSTHVVWLTGGIEKDTARFFLDFDEPEESKGLRFLLIVPKGQPLKAYMFLPATKKTLLLAAEDPSMDLGGTGLTVEDIRVFLPKGGETETLVGEETVDGRECYKIKVVSPEIEGDRFIWVSKKELLVLKTSNVNAKGKTDRVMRVVEFFKTAKGTEFPREEEISIPDRGIKIRVRQENAVFGVTIPDELLDPKTFGTYQWKP